MCWAYIDNAYIIYIHHPDVQGKSLSNETITELLAKDELLTLEKLFHINSSINFILELKTGNGDINGFFREFKKILERFNVKNVVVDAFSVEQLRGLKTVMPRIKTSLHTKLVLGKYVLETTFEKPYIRVHNLFSLDFIDYVTISYTTTHVNLFNLDIDTSYKNIFAANKCLSLGSVKSLESFKKVITSKVEYIYLRSDDVRQNYTNILKTIDKEGI